MFHSVGIEDIPWVWSDLSQDVASFEQILQGLADEGFKTVGLDDLYRHMSGDQQLPPNRIVLTLDDGYLDNWVYVVPLLRRFGMRATVYVTPEFVDPEPVVRPTADDLDSEALQRSSAHRAGFMSWHELAAAEREGVLDVQSHALTHTWYFSGPNLVDLHRPGHHHRYPWLSWNMRRERKPYYLTEDQQEFVPWGTPVLEHGKSLVTRRFEPDAALQDEIIRFVAEQGAAEFLATEDWQQAFAARFGPVGDFTFPGRLETTDEYRDRVLDELVRSREIIGSRLGKTVDFLCWPGGGVSEEAVELARQAGYRSWTLSSWQQPEFRNRPGANPETIKRVAGQGAVYWRNRKVQDDFPGWTVLRVLIHQGSTRARINGKLRKALWTGKAMLRGSTR
jgi:peptidoglycan/xylan/chitin deacetylase (PgdA/CDA1 family)